MHLDPLDALIRRYLSAALAVAVLLVAPATGPGPLTDRDPPARDPSAHDTAAGAEAGTPDTGTAGAEGRTAAGRLGWGRPDREDEFTAGSPDWTVHQGPGHDGQGVRSADALTIEDGEVLVITGDPTGTTGGLCWGGAQRYGRWEGRVRAPGSDPAYDAVMLLWPAADDYPAGGQIAFMEMLDPTRRTTDFFLHHGADGGPLTSRVRIDATRWHNWAVEWTPDAVTGYVDGREWFRSTDPGTFPPGPMRLCLQLDWFPTGAGPARESRMEVDRVRQWSLDGAPGDTDGVTRGSGPWPDGQSPDTFPN